MKIRLIKKLCTHWCSGIEFKKLGIIAAEKKEEFLAEL